MNYNYYIRKWLRCNKNFQFFKKGELYWLKRAAYQKYTVNSDNAKGKTAAITDIELVTYFDRTEKDAK